MSALSVLESESLHISRITELADLAFDILMPIFAFYTLYFTLYNVKPNHGPMADASKI